MLSLVELFDLCANRKDYTTVKTEDGKYEVDYKFLEDAEARTLYIFFEPSDGDVDWRVNFAFPRKPYSDMEVTYRVHGGFLESWKLVKNAIRAKVKEQEEDSTDYKWRKVVTVGYSHGGALAVLCHECIWFERPDIRSAIEGYSFDGPRVYGGLRVKKELEARWEKFTTFRNQDDIVTHLPPICFFFRHVGNLAAIGDPWRAKARVFEEWMRSKFKDKELMQEFIGIKPHYPGEIRESLKAVENRD